MLNWYRSNQWSPWNGGEETKSTITYTYSDYGVSRKEFEDLQKEVKQVRKLLSKIQFVTDNVKQSEDYRYKVDFLKKIAEAVGVKLSDIADKK